MSAEFRYCDGCSGYECDPIKGCAYPGISPRPTKPERGLTDDTKYFVGDDGVPLDLGAGDVLAIHDKLPETPPEAYALGWNECRAVFLAAQCAQPKAGEAVAERIADAVLSWMVKFDLLDAGNEYGPEDVLAVLNDLAPAPPQPANPVQVTDALKSAEKALRPFYDAVFNDNGDITVDGPHDYDEAVAGYFAYKKIERALAAIGAGGQAVAGIGAGGRESPLEWAVEKWHHEVANRPLKNVHRAALDTTWRQVIRHFGGNPDALCGPDHYTMIGQNPDGFALSQPHPADERVVEALPEGTLSMHGNDVVIQYAFHEQAQRAFDILEAALAQESQNG